MVLLYSNNVSSRLRYISAFIFGELMQVDLSITKDYNEYRNFDGIKICYGSTKETKDQPTGFNIASTRLLFESDVKEEKIECFEVNGYKAFFKTGGPDFPFDIFAASFYLLSRYEEYLPFKEDEYGRYGHKNSLAFRESFLEIPLVNIWVRDFTKALQAKYPSLTVTPPKFKFIPTYDIDIAYAYSHKGFMRNLGGGIKSLVTSDISALKERTSVLIGRKKDPFEEYYDRLDSLHRQYDLHPLYFFLVAQKNNRFDKNISPEETAMKQLIKRHTNKYVIGLHPSWQSWKSIRTLKKEKELLEEASQLPVIHSRQHFIKFELPTGYRKLIELRLLNDHSMGYGSINGFRASVASSFFWYDLRKEEQTELRIHPFCYMEANSYYEEKLLPDAAFKELMHYFNICKEVNGTLITIWHNHILANDKFFNGWGKLYEDFLKKVSETS